jgi:hypothetical protein
LNKLADFFNKRKQTKKASDFKSRRQALEAIEIQQQQQQKLNTKKRKRPQ